MQNREHEVTCTKTIVNLLVGTNSKETNYGKPSSRHLGCRTGGVKNSKGRGWFGCSMASTMENDPFMTCDGISLWKMVCFHIYVKLPQGIHCNKKTYLNHEIFWDIPSFQTIPMYITGCLRTSHVLHEFPHRDTLSGSTSPEKVALLIQSHLLHYPLVK